jgi:hypothetical protein
MQAKTQLTALPRHEALCVKVATDREALELLRHPWEQWSNGLETDVDYYLQELKNDWTIVRPYVISVWRADVCLGLLIARVRNRQASTVVAGIRLPGPRARMLEIVPRGRLGSASREVDELLLAQLAKALKSEADLLCFRRLPVDSTLFEEVWRIPGVLIRKRMPHIFSYTSLSLTKANGRPPAVFSGKAMREARRKTLKLKRAFSNEVSLRCFSKLDELEAGLRDAEKVSAAAWQHSLGVGFTDTLPTLEGYRFLARKGWLRIYVLYVKQEPCAYLLGLLRRRSFYCQRTGYLPDFAQFSVGSVLTSSAFESLAASGAESVDLGEGGQEHNRRQGSERHDEGTVHVYAPTLRGFALNAFFGVSGLIRAGGRKTRAKLRLDRGLGPWPRWVSRWLLRHSTAEPSAQASEAW